MLQLLISAWSVNAAAATGMGETIFREDRQAVDNCLADSQKAKHRTIT